MEIVTFVTYSELSATNDDLLLQVSFPCYNFATETNNPSKSFQMKNQLLLLLAAVAALPAVAQQTVYFNPDTVATDVRPWNFTPNIARDAKFIYEPFEDRNPEGQIALNWSLTPLRVGVTAKGKPVTVVYNPIIHAHEVRIGDRVVAAGNDLYFSIPRKGDADAMFKKGSLDNNDKITVKSADRDITLDITAADFEQRLRDAVGPRPGFVREGYSYCFADPVEGDDKTSVFSKFTAVTMDIPEDRKLSEAVMRYIAGALIPCETFDYKFENGDGGHALICPDRAPVISAMP